MSEIIQELARLEESCEHSAQNQFEQSKIWRGLNLALAVPSAAIAALTGGSLLADEISATFAGVLALMASVLTGVLATLRASERGEDCQQVGNEYLALQRDARISRTIDVLELEHEPARALLDDLVQRQNKLNRAASVPSGLARRRGKRNIEAGGQLYRVDG